jgi:hypothetical protein
MNREIVEKVVKWFATHSENAQPISIPQEPYSPLIIEIEGDILWVGYWYKQHGDLLPDSVIRIDLSQMTGECVTLFGNMEDDQYIDAFLKEILTRLSLHDRKLSGA